MELKGAGRVIAERFKPIVEPAVHAKYHVGFHASPLPHPIHTNLLELPACSKRQAATAGKGGIRGEILSRLAATVWQTVWGIRFPPRHRRSPRQPATGWYWESVSSPDV